MNYIFIINPTSGNKKGKYIGQVIDEYLKEKNINYKIYYTNKKNDATWIANMYRSNNDIVYCLGGDGTLNEVINGLAYSLSSLSIVPVGSGNDFYRSFKDFDGDVIDLGLVNNRYFINVATLGLDAIMANDANKLKERNIPNKIVYPLSIIKNYLKLKTFNANIEEEIKNFTILAICNGAYYGGGFNIGPNAILDDGYFDIIEVEKMNRLQVLNLIMKLIKVKHLNNKGVNYYTTNNILVESKIPLLCNVDGEIIEDNKFKFTIKPKALKLLKDDSLQIKELLKIKNILK